MKSFARLLLAALVIVSHAFAQQFSHVVIVIQENRTPDNLFGAYTIPGADLSPIGSGIPLAGEIDRGHSHYNFVAEVQGKWPSGSVAFVSDPAVDPYYQLAISYGFANRMFQTNQGPSVPAHHFLFEGTSQPSEGSALFEAGDSTVGCLLPGSTSFIDPEGRMSPGSPCLDPVTLADLIEAAGLSWKYYAQSKYTLWNAPIAIEHICQPSGSVCAGADYNVITPPTAILTDIAKGTLADISWVTPGSGYSDHPGGGGAGPAWVASIVNAIGQSSYWSNTIIFVTWDDWGGWYDHVAPLPSRSFCPPTYCYGFRVPLLIISAQTPANCIDNNDYDSGGSFLAFVEDNFSLPRLGHADSSTPNSLSATPCIVPQSNRQFQPIAARKMTKAEIEAPGDPDDD